VHDEARRDVSQLAVALAIVDLDIRRDPLEVVNGCRDDAVLAGVDLVFLLVPIVRTRSARIRFGLCLVDFKARPECMLLPAGPLETGH